MNAPVTLKAKRYRPNYVYVCWGCDLLADSERSDAITCSPACRVAWHRNPRRAEILESMKKPFFEGVTPAGVARIRAVNILRPDIAKRLWAGEVFDYRTEVWTAYWERVSQAVEAGK